MDKATIFWAPHTEDLPYFEPKKSTRLAAAYDVFLPSIELLGTGTAHKIYLNLTCFMPENFRATLMARSGLSAKFKMVILGGLIDADYAGCWHFTCVLVPNAGDAGLDLADEDRYYYDATCQEGFLRFDKGERIGQVVFTEVPDTRSELVSPGHVQCMHDARGSDRTGGFGSTGD